MKEQLDYIFLFYGLGLVMLAAVCFACAKSGKYSLPWVWLGFAGLFGGLMEWLDMIAVDLGSSAVFSALRVCAMTAFFICLVEFARISTKSISGRKPGRWVTFALFIAGCAGWRYGWPGLNITFRYTLGFVGAMWAGVNLLLASRRVEAVAPRRSIFAIGLMSCLYALSIAMVLPRSPFQLPFSTTDNSFLDYYGIPVQLIRGLLIVAVAAGIWHALNVREHLAGRKYILVLAAMAVALLGAGWLLTEYTGRAESRQAMASLLTECHLSAAAMDYKLVDGLGSVNDVKDPRFYTLRRRLAAMRRHNPQFRWIYLMTVKHGRIIFTADSEPTNSPDYSPPGDEYFDAPASLRELCSGRRSSATCEYKDRWGRWISAFVPVRNDANGKIVAILGMDRELESLESAVAYSRVQPIAITLLAFALLTLFGVEYARQRESLNIISVSETALRRSDDRYRTLFNSMTEGFALHDVILDENGVPCDYRVVEANPAFSVHAGIDHEDLLAHTALELVPDLEPIWIQRYCEVALTGKPASFEDYISGLDRYFEVHSFSPEYGRFAVLGRDITERKQAEAQIRLNSAALNAANDLIVIMDPDGMIIAANDALKRQIGYFPNEVIGQHLSLLWPKTQNGRFLERVWVAIASGQAWAGEMLCMARDESSFTADVSITPLPSENGEVTHLVAIARNVSEKKAYEDQLDYQAHHDALTDLPNRQAFSDELAALVSDRRNRDEHCAILFIDLDRFKLVNDTMGHQAGDALLIEVASRLGSCLREDDVLARMGGDEFTVLLRHVQSPEQAGSVAYRMLDQVSLPFDIGTTRLVIGASIGISLYPENATNVVGLLKSADAAMYRAKELGRNNCQFYSEELSQTNLARVEMEHDLRLALKQDEFKVYYQPIIDAKTMHIIGAEALLRWEHPEKGMISPGLFVPVAEETGMILDMGRTVLQVACEQCKKWQDLGYGEMEIAVNVSPTQLRNGDFISEVLGAASEAGIAPRCLKLEITETVLAKNDYDEIDILSVLKALGVSICLDDFGIGYSSLSRLKDLPIVHMKVDGSFIRDIERNSKDKAMTESIIAMAHNLGIKVTAEWIEDEEQLATIQAMGCDYVQGYLVSPALSAEGFESFLQTWPNRQLPTIKAA